MNKRNRLLFSTVAGIIVLACACPATGLPAVNNPATATIPAIATQPDIPTIAPPENNALLTDDFSVESSELETFSDDSGSAGIQDGAYVVRATGELWNWGRSNTDFTDTAIEFDLTITEAPSNNNAGAGVICRMKARDDNSIDGYLLAISSDGYYSIRSITSSDMTALVDWTESSSIHQGSEQNKIRATCNGSDLQLEVNGDVLAIATADGSGPSSGGFAFAAVSFETAEPIAEAHFDNLVITKP